MGGRILLPLGVGWAQPRQPADIAPGASAGSPRGSSLSKARPDTAPQRHLRGREVAPGHLPAVQHKTSGPRGPKALPGRPVASFSGTGRLRSAHIAPVQLCQISRPSGTGVAWRSPQVTRGPSSTKRADLDGLGHCQSDPRPRFQVPAVCAARI